MKLLPLFCVLITIAICQADSDLDTKHCLIQPIISIANKTLFFQTYFKANFFTAQHFCRSYCLELVSIKSLQAHDGIVEYIREIGMRDDSFWTSGNDLGKTGDFYWLSSGRRMEFTNWNEGHPNHTIFDVNTSNCVILSGPNNHFWIETSCDDKNYFICERHV